MTCTASDQCHGAGTCNPATGTCSNPTIADGTSCNDGNSCTSGDTCQSGSCAPGGTNTCASIALTQIVYLNNAQPTMTTTLLADDASVAAGDVVGFTAAVTNTGTTLNLQGTVDVHNTGSSAFNVAGFQHVLEYQAVPSGEWTPFARIAYDAAGTLVPETTLLQLQYTWLQSWWGSSNATFPVYPANPVVATSIAADGTAQWVWQLAPSLPPDVVAIVFDPEQSAGVRTVFRFDTPSGPPQSVSDPLSTPGVTGDINDVAVQLRFPFVFGASADVHGPLVSVETGALASGSTRIFTGTFAAPPLLAFPQSPGQSEANYVSSLFFAALGYQPGIVVTAHAASVDPAQISGPKPTSPSRCRSS